MALNRNHAFFEQGDVIQPTTFELDLITLHSQLRMIITLSRGPYMQNLKHNLE